MDFKLGKDLSYEKLETLFQGTRKTLKLLISKTNSHYDPTGLISPLISQLRDTCRQATLYCKGLMEAEVHESIWSLWLHEHYEVLRCATYAYPRLQDAQIIEYGQITIITAADASILG